MTRKFLSKFGDFLWDLWCLTSVVGIWPRWIEPRILFSTRLNLAIDPELKGLKIAFFSDLHLNEKTPESLLKKIVVKTQKFEPDLIVFAGDFLCYSKLHAQDKFHAFLNSFSAPLGCYAALGNHDYDQSVGFNENGDYDLLMRKRESFIVAGLNRLFKAIVPSGKHSDRLSSIKCHDELHKHLHRTPFRLLHNETVQCVYKGKKINVTGVGEYSVNQCRPEAAFAEYDTSASGVVLAHNPDAMKLLTNFPGNLVCSGHTHGGQINLPWIWKRLTVLENMKYKSGLFSENEKKLYVSRGVSSAFSFRWFSPPELVLITLE